MKRLLAMLLVVLLTISLLACGDESDENSRNLGSKDKYTKTETVENTEGKTESAGKTEMSDKTEESTETAEPASTGPIMEKKQFLTSTVKKDKDGNTVLTTTKEYNEVGKLLFSVTKDAEGNVTDETENTYNSDNILIRKYTKSESSEVIREYDDNGKEFSYHFVGKMAQSRIKSLVTTSTET